MNGAAAALRSVAALLVVIFLVALGLVACDGGGYQQSGGRWRHDDAPFTPRDPASFKPLDARFARDALSGYCRGSQVEGSDGASFAVVSEHEARDRASVWYCDTYRKGQEYFTVRHVRIERIDGADPATYVSIGKGYARDRSRVYDEGHPFTVREPASFEPLDGGFGRDAQRGYHARVEIPGSHGPSFETVDTRDVAYARDRAKAYYGLGDSESPREPNAAPRPAVRTLAGAEPASLRVLGRGYAADARHVWHRGLPVAGADAATFAVDDSYQGEADASDASGKWQSGKRLAAPQ